MQLRSLASERQVLVAETVVIGERLVVDIGIIIEVGVLLPLRFEALQGIVCICALPFVGTRGLVAVDTLAVAWIWIHRWITRRRWHHSRDDKLDVVQVHDIKIIRVQACQTSVDAATNSGWRVIERGSIPSITTTFRYLLTTRRHPKAGMNDADNDNAT